MEKYKTIDNWRFEWNQEHEFYECQGAICHDNEHDEIPEPELWEAALELEQELKDALNDEDYEKAAQIRDLIQNRRKSGEA